ncbi:MAG: CHAP domain-containing protein [Baekduia sp.]
MSVESVMTRIAAIHQSLQPRVETPARETLSTDFESHLDQASYPGLLTSTTALNTLQVGGIGAPVGASGAGARALAFAQQEVGVAEQPPGSNDAPRIADYRASTAGAGIGPWCAYFVSWAAKQAGAPLGEAGQGFGAVASAWDWAQRTGRAVPATQTPQAGDLIVWDGTHVGIVESVGADGSVHTIEGNSSNAVTRRVHDRTGDGASGYIRL